MRLKVDDAQSGEIREVLKLRSGTNVTLDLVNDELAEVELRITAAAAAGVSLQLATSPGAGATSFDINSAPPPALKVGSIIAIDAYTTECELRVVSNISGLTLTVAALTYGHSSGDPVLQYEGGLVSWTLFGGKGTGSTGDATTNVTAFNRAGTQLLALGSGYGGGIFIPAGTWYVDGELIMQHGQTIAGVSPDLSLIKAHTTFPFSSTGEVAIMHGTRTGTPTSYANGGPLSRYFLRDFYVGGENISNSNGILASLQQPAHWENIRVDKCAGLYGIAVSGQHAIFRNLELVQNVCALRVRGASIFFWDGLNIENGQGTTHVIIDNNAFHLAFKNLHLEVGNETIGFDCSAGVTGLSFHDVWYTNPSTGSCFKFADTGASAKPRYILSNIRCNTNSSTYYIVDDASRSLQLNSFAATDRTITLMVAHSNDDFPPIYTGAGKYLYGITGPLDLYGPGSPEGTKSAPIGSTYRRTDGGAGTSFYVKESGTGNAGWVGK